MTEIEFSYIFDAQGDDRIWSLLMEEFSDKYGVKIKLRRMDWDNAWAQLFSFTSVANSPHVSHVGNTWVSSLARMNTLRAFKPAEIAEIGEAADFIAPNWKSGILAGDSRIWAIPWTAWIYVFAYRKDLLQQAGVDPVGAFGTIQSDAATVKRLATSPLEMPWLNAQLPNSRRDLLHIASSWIWSAGGDFVDVAGNRALFNSPPSIAGLKAWLEIYRAVPEKYKRLSQQETFELFGTGRATALLCNIRAANTFINSGTHPEVTENLGIASTAEIPWTGGGSLVIWDNLHGYPEHERAALDLVKFLASKRVQVSYGRQTNSMPSRLDALDELYPQGNPAREAVQLSASTGRGYYNMPIWRRVEAQLAEEFGQTVIDAAEHMDADLDDMLHKRLDNLAARLNLTLES